MGIVISKEKSLGTLTRMARRDVPNGFVFKMVKRDGSMGDVAYAAIAQNGKNFSINTSNGALASTGSDDKQVVIVGKFTYATTRHAVAADMKATARSLLKLGDLFMAKGKHQVYGNVGQLNDGRFASINMDNGNYGVTSKGSRNVVKVGEFSLDIETV